MHKLAKDFMVDYDDAGSIGKRYRRQDEIGTPFCITWTSIPRRTAASRCASVTAWSRSASPSRK